jgi:hypothetical protein
MKQPLAAAGGWEVSRELGRCGINVELGTSFRMGYPLPFLLLLLLLLELVLLLLLHYYYY